MEVSRANGGNVVEQHRRSAHTALTRGGAPVDTADSQGAAQVVVSVGAAEAEQRVRLLSMDGTARDQDGDEARSHPRKHSRTVSAYKPCEAAMPRRYLMAACSPAQFNSPGSVG